jgi:tetratricopeptide (TPR) repeat protein
MPQPQGPRFVHHLKSHLIHFHKNLYISRSDPRYYEKVVRFLDPSSPEAHFRLAQKYEAESNRVKAIQHYRASMKRYPSDYYYRAASAIRRLETPAPDGQPAEQTTSGTQLPFKALAGLLLFLILFNAVLLLLLFHSGALGRTVSTLKFWDVGKEVAYETVEQPYAMYFAGGADPKEVEQALYEHTLQLGRSNPNRAVIVYGLTAESGPVDGQAYPLTDPDRAKLAFVEARYYAAQDQNVSIRFLSVKPDSAKSPQLTESQSLTMAGANYVRTALFAYKRDHGSFPDRIERLAADYPGNYMSFVPREPASGKSDVVSRYDGKGGWVYDPEAAGGAAEALFYPNVAGGGKGGVPYDPLRIVVGKEEHELLLVSGKTVLLQERVGLGANGGTPNGRFAVSERVRDPQGSAPNVYGSAGLGLGDIAVHGTLQERSVGADMSKGCIRVRDADMQQLYPLVPRGTVVDIAAKLPQIEGAATPLTGADLAQLQRGDDSHPDEGAHGKTFYWRG